MHTKGAKLCSYLVILFMLAAIGVRAYSLRVSFAGAPWVTYSLLTLGIALIAFECFRNKGYAEAFGGTQRFHLDVFAAIGALGFFVEFAQQCIRIYQSVESGMYHLPAYFVPKCIICAAALLSSMYFCALAMYYKSSRYEIREMKLIHLVPLVWAIGRMLTVIEQAEILGTNPNALLKYATLIFALCFYYMYAFEIEKGGSARGATLFFARSFSLFGFMYFTDSLMLVLSGEMAAADENAVLSLSMLMLCGYAFFFEKNIISKTTEIN